MSKAFVPDAHYRSVVQDLAARIHQWHADGARIIGISGAQGTGKSTLSEQLGGALRRKGLSVAALSLDDLYLTRAQRSRLAAERHPLLLTRGVPGTHDVELGMATLGALLRSGRVSLPRFVKARDDRAPHQDWPRVQGPVDLVLFEGWCLGVKAEVDDPTPLNRLEAEEDADGRWRRFVESQLAGPYRPLFGRVDRWIYLEVPGFEQIPIWRREQELENAARVPGTVPMSDAALGRFILHYERLTRRGMKQLPQMADIILELQADHRLGRLRDTRPDADPVR